MAELITAIHDHAAWLYGLIGLLILRELAAMWRAGRERDLAWFGLEREAAAGKAQRSLVMLILLVTIGLGVYTVAQLGYATLTERERLEVQTGALVEAPRQIGLPTDTREPPGATPTRRVPRIVTAAPSLVATASPVPPLALCRNANVDIVAPGTGTVLSGPTPIEVTVRFDAGTGRSFKLEIGAGSVPSAWALLGGPYTEPVVAKTVLVLSPESLKPGVYALRLSLAGPEGDVAQGDACAVTLRVP